MPADANLAPLEESPTRKSLTILIAGNAAFQKDLVDVVDAPDVAIIETAGTIDDVDQKLSEVRVDCIIADNLIDDQNSLVLCELVRVKHGNTVAVIVVADHADTKTVLKAFRTGVSDYVIRDHVWEHELNRAIRRSVKHCRDVANLLNENEYLASLATYDRATGLPNRRFIEDRLNQVLQSGIRYDNPVAVLLVEINNLDKINATFGHALGDKALRAFGRKLMQVLRAIDTVGRYGTNAFLALVDHDVSEGSVELIGDRLTGELSFSIEEGSTEIFLSPSIGVALCPWDGATTEALLAAANEAVRAAKAVPEGSRCFAKALASDPPVETRERSDVANGGAAPRAPGVVLDRPSPAATVSGDAATRSGGSPPNAIQAAPVRKKRRERRARVFKPGRLILNNGFSTIDCLVRDLSSIGARVTLEESVVLPDRFEFELLETGDVRPAAKRWHRGNSFGLEFLTSDEKEPHGGSTST